MIPVQVQTPTFFFERATERLTSKSPVEGMERLEANLRAFRAWVAEPAYREQSPEDAVEHVLRAVGGGGRAGGGGAGKAGFLRAR